MSETILTQFVRTRNLTLSAGAQLDGNLALPLAQGARQRSGQIGGHQHYRAPKELEINLRCGELL